MNPGEWLLTTAFAAAIASLILYAPALRGRRLAAAGPVFAIHTLALVSAAALLWHYFVAHRFDYAYVAHYSSRALSPHLALAASWAGQEGSILLWAALGAVLGLALMRQPGGLARPAMFFVSLIQCGLMVLLMVKGPFVRNLVIPADGQGLNPLLEDPWMVVHPPMLFVGYAALGVPFALAAAALIRREYRAWNRMVWPWTLFAVVTLGAGIALGGIWAYKVLGWGGYWGWDPVENASLIPWLVAIALLHGLLIQRTTGAVIRTNLLLALLSWVAVLGGTYLTRSGVLQDFSVHSFADSGLNLPLTSFLFGTALLSAALLAWRWRSVEAGMANWLSLSREAALWMGLVTVLVLTTLVTFGTTAPLLTRLAGSPASVQTSFYRLVTVPLGIALVLLMGFAPALRWSRQHGLSWIRALVPGIVAGVAAMGVAWAAGTRETGSLALIGLAGLALAVNAVMTVRLFMRGWSYGAGYLAHAGIAVMVLGMVLSSSLGRTERVHLKQDRPVTALGYTLTYQGEEPDAKGEPMLKIQVEKPGFRLAARPRLFPSPQGEGMIRKPEIARRGELYVSPVDVVPAELRSAEPTWLAQGQEVLVAGVGYTFAGFRMQSHGRDMAVFTDIRVRRGESSSTVAPGIRISDQGRHAVDAEVAGLGKVALARIDADGKRVAVMLPGAALAPASAVVDLSTKPLINLVWLGAVLAILGSILAGLRRAAEGRGARRSAPREARDTVAPGPSPVATSS